MAWFNVDAGWQLVRRHLTDGETPAFMLDEWGAELSHGTALIDIGLWAKTAEGYRFHAWKEYQHSRADVEAKRDRERQSRRSGCEWSQWDRTRDTKRSPYPLAPAQPSPIREGAAERGILISEPFVVSPEMAAWAREHTSLVDGKRSTERFAIQFASMTGKNATKLDWTRTWRNWLLRDQENAEKRSGVKPTTVDHGRSVDQLLAEREQPKLTVGA